LWAETAELLGKGTRVEINDDDYQVSYDTKTQTVTCTGSFRLGGTEEYAAIVKLLNDAKDQEPLTLTLDLRSLTFLNSSGINVLSRFVIAVRETKSVELRVLGSQAIPWQTNSLINFQRLMPSLQLEFE
jgi:hypothetical protein